MLIPINGWNTQLVIIISPWLKIDNDSFIIGCEFKIGVTQGFVLWLVFKANYSDIINAENSGEAKGYANINDSAKKYFDLDISDVPIYHDGKSGKTIILKMPSCKSLENAIKL